MQANSNFEQSSEPTHNENICKLNQENKVNDIETSNQINE